MSRKTAFVLFIVAVLLTILGYVVDSDPPYENKFHTAAEAVMLTIILYGVVVAVYFGIRSLRNLFRSITK